MKRFIKICLIVAVACLVIGLGCLVGGIALGGNFHELARAFERGDFTIGSSVTKATDWEDENEFYDDYEDEVYDDYDDDFDDADDMDDFIEKEASVGGASRVFSDIDKLEIEMRSGYLSLVPHEDNEIQVEVKEDNGKATRVLQERNEVKLVNHYRNYKGGVTVYYPENSELREVEIAMDGGEVMIEGPLTVGELDVQLGAGRFEGGVIKARQCSWEVGAGEAVIDEITGDEIELECGAGTLQAAVKGSESDYDYDLECGIGVLLVGNEEYSGIAGEKKINNGQPRKIEASCGIGTLEVQFH